MNISKQIDERLKIVQEKEQQWLALEKLMKENAAKSKTKISLNVGGKKFATSKSTLLSCQGTYFYAMLSSGHWQPDEDGEYFIDRNPKFFGIILDFLRTGKLDTKGLDKDSLEKLKQDLDYYLIKAQFEIKPDIIQNPTYQIEFNAPYHPANSRNTAESLQDGNWMSGVCCNSPGWMIVDFQKEIFLNNLQVVGYHGNSVDWYPGNGNNASILYSINKRDWTNTGQKLGNLESSKPNFICLGGLVARYVKFDHNAFLGFSVLMFNVDYTK